MSIKIKAFIWIMAITAVTAAILVYSNYLSNAHFIERTKKTELGLVAKLIQNDLIDQSNDAMAKVALITERQDVKEAFREQDRDKLANLLLPTFKTLKNKYNVREAQFNIAPATVFFRLHNIKTFGDDDSTFREMVLMAHKNKKDYQGIEVGRSGVNIRGIDIIEDDKGVIGSFEIGMSFGTILDDIKKTVDFEAAVFMNDSLMTKVATARPRAPQERIFGNLQGIGATDWEKILPLMDEKMLSKVNDVTSMTKNIQGTDYGVVLLPLLDFRGNEIGVVVAVSNYSHFQAELRQAMITSAALALFQIIFVSCIVLIALHVLYARPLEDVNATMQKWLANDDTAKLDAVAQRKDEIGLIASNATALKLQRDQLKKA